MGSSWVAVRVLDSGVPCWYCTELCDVLYCSILHWHAWRNVCGDSVLDVDYVCEEHCRICERDICWMGKPWRRSNERADASVREPDGGVWTGLQHGMESCDGDSGDVHACDWNSSFLLCGRLPGWELQVLDYVWTKVRDEPMGILRTGGAEPEIVGASLDIRDVLWSGACDEREPRVVLPDIVWTGRGNCWTDCVAFRSDESVCTVAGRDYF
mmetsp:Transcript_23547/g.33841  ORF Transcript_23547/g.33841 Transcript_23547/m.33841 type:complete len:212 (-) Transcript_23547:591-1226(-)